MIRSAEDARKLTNRSGGELPGVYQAVTDLVQERIGNAAKRGLSQVTVELPYKLYKATDMDELKKELLEAGYAVLSGRLQGILGDNIFREAKYTLTVMW